MNQSKAILIGVSAMLFLFAGIWISVFGTIIIQNYDSPYLFTFIFGGTGLLLGVVLAHTLKTTYLRYMPRRNGFTFFTMCIAVGFFGLMLWTGALTNGHLAAIGNCGRYVLTNKYQTGNFYRSPKIFYLIVEINEQDNRLISNGIYWDKVAVGGKIGICKFKSRIGFDYQKLMDE
jgi:hypothetical protein